MPRKFRAIRYENHDNYYVLHVCQLCAVFMSNLYYSGTSIKRTPLGNSLLAVIERWSLGGFDCQLHVCMLYESFLAENESWSFAN